MNTASVQQFTQIGLTFWMSSKTALLRRLGTPARWCDDAGELGRRPRELLGVLPPDVVQSVEPLSLNGGTTATIGLGFSLWHKSKKDLRV